MFSLSFYLKNRNIKHFSFKALLFAILLKGDKKYTFKKNTLYMVHPD